MTIQGANRQLLDHLAGIYDDREAAAIANLVMEKLTALSRIDRIVKNTIALSETQQEQLDRYIKSLLEYRPVQYVLEEAWFCGLRFYVNGQVLIPRPETEELVQWIIDAMPAHGDGWRLLDIGTGSGCIAVTLKAALMATEMWAIDNSKGALEVAFKNAAENNTDIRLVEVDIANETQWKLLPEVNVIVSNPPYIRKSEAPSMCENVTQYEPHEALFVNDEDALFFYKKIADFGTQHLVNGGMLFFEINEALGDEVSDLLKKKGYRGIQLKKDLQQKDRMIKATWEADIL